MRYYLDTEFIDHAKQHRVLGIPVGKPVSTTELISIGIVSEDGDTYYAICNEFDLKAAWKDDWVRNHVLRPLHEELCKMQGTYARTYHYELFEKFNIKSLARLLKWSGKSRWDIRREVVDFCKEPSEFYGYFADYDWVVLCHLFGRMIDLPTGWPMYCIDLKQILDGLKLKKDWVNGSVPKNKNEHNALDDARWNMALHEALIATQA